jgi:transcriptional regulator with PAS, ATPase and Fis domain
MLNEIGQELNNKIKFVDPEVMCLLKEYDWPGNVRELQNVVERIVNINDGDAVKLEHLPNSIKNYNGNKIVELTQWLPSTEIEGLNERKKRKQYQEEKERQRIIDLLDEYGGNISQVAKEMSISRSTVYRRMQQYNINN